MPSTSHYSPLSAILSISRYRAPLKLSFLYLTPRRFIRHRFRAVRPPELAAALAACSYRRLPNSHVFTGNSLFSRMEVRILLHVFTLSLCVFLFPVWRFCDLNWAKEWNFSDISIGWLNLGITGFCFVVAVSVTIEPLVWFVKILN